MKLILEIKVQLQTVSNFTYKRYHNKLFLHQKKAQLENNVLHLKKKSLWEGGAGGFPTPPAGRLCQHLASMRKLWPLPPTNNHQQLTRPLVSL